MKTRLYFGIALRIVLLFSVGMAMAYVKPFMHDFFGDTVHVCKSKYCRHSPFIDDGYEWGAMHYWFFWMCFALFILSGINCFLSIKQMVNKEYPEL